MQGLLTLYGISHKTCFGVILIERLKIMFLSIIIGY